MQFCHNPDSHTITHSDPRLGSSWNLASGDTGIYVHFRVTKMMAPMGLLVQLLDLHVRKMDYLVL